MGKFMRKCKGIGEVAVMEISHVGVRTRARTMAEAQTKRKFSSDHFNFASSYFQRRKLEINSSPALSSTTCSKPNSDSSDGSSELVDESLRSGVDLEEDSPNIERRGTTSSESNDMESAGRVSSSSEVNSRHPTYAAKTPTDSEIQDFFSAAEKHDKERFAEKYNYDIEKDVPLEGRYEWSRVKP